MNVQGINAVGFYAKGVKPWRTPADRIARKAREVAGEETKPTPKLRQNVSDRNDKLHKEAAKQINRLTGKIESAKNYIEMMNIAKSHTEDPKMINFINKELAKREQALSGLQDTLTEAKANLAGAYYKISGNL